ncbi:hypothetical protein PHMEG_0009122 [Phytophthora megakarya]|uniref:Chromo domain-containing protein n=1 Tax=Phytophthora megakarya TaxID=4795 RepID=A0A225WHB6_9STRA|nr:hypothetical protein PHMEG_0009122 [Phytophthora megakarya]
MRHDRSSLHERGLPSVCRDDAVEILREFELSAASKWTTRKVCQDGDAIGQRICRKSLQQDWDEIAEHLVFAINTSMDTTRKETPFYLVVPDEREGEHEVEAILDNSRPLSTRPERSMREFNVKWVEYEGPTWEPASNLSCGGLLYDYLQNKESEHRMKMVQVADKY